MEGYIKAVCISRERGTIKQNVKEAVLIPRHGLEGDAHAGTWHRQVSLLSQDKVKEFNQRGGMAEPGDFGENILLEGIDLAALPVGTILECGTPRLKITQIGKECHHHCQIYQRVGDCIMPREGVFARVLRGGKIEIGYEMAVEKRTEKRKYQAAVITLSDKGSLGEREDKSGPLLQKRLQEAGYEVVEYLLLPDDKEALKKQLIRLSDQRQLDLILTTGGTGFSSRDTTPEATLEIADRNAPGIAEAIRSYSMKITPHAMLSRGASVIRGKTLIINLPGSPKACGESLDCILGSLPHGLDLL